MIEVIYLGMGMGLSSEELSDPDYRKKKNKSIYWLAKEIARGHRVKQHLLSAIRYLHDRMKRRALIKILVWNAKNVFGETPGS